METPKVVDKAEMNQSQEQLVDPRIDSLAAPLASDYAKKNYQKLEDGTFQPAWRGRKNEIEYRNKSPEDLIREGMSEEEAKAAVIDIANTPFDQFSEYWKEVNRSGARFLINLIDNTPDAKNEIASADFVNDETMRNKYGDLVHIFWMTNNDWQKDSHPELFLPFNEGLDPTEQQKDIDQLVILQEWLKSQSTNEKGS